MIDVKNLYSLCTVSAKEIDWYDDYAIIQPNRFMYTALQISVTFQRDYDGVTGFVCLVVFEVGRGLGHNTDRSYTMQQSNVPIDRVFSGTDLTQLDIDYIKSFYPNEVLVPTSTKHYGQNQDDTLTLNVGDIYCPPNRDGFFYIQKVISGYDQRYPFNRSFDIYFDHFYPHIYQNVNGLEYKIRKEIKGCCFFCQSDYQSYHDLDNLINKAFLRRLPNSNYFPYDLDFFVVVGFFNDYGISSISLPRINFQIRSSQHTYSMFLNSSASLDVFRNFVSVHFGYSSTGRQSTNIISKKPSFVFQRTSKVFCNDSEILSVILDAFTALDPSISLSISHNDYVTETPFCVYDPNHGGDWMIPVSNPYQEVN